MRCNLLGRRLLLAAGGLALLVPISAGLSEVAKTGEPEARPSPPSVTLVPPRDQELRAQCWQSGVKIIDQDGLQGLSLDALNQDRSVSFKRRAEDRPSVFLLPFPDGLCLIQPKS